MATAAGSAMDQTVGARVAAQLGTVLSTVPIEPVKQARDPAVRRAARRNQLLDAALRAIRRTGWVTSMESIAAEGGVSKPVVYKHFGDREGLAIEVARRFAAGLEVDMAAALEAETDPRQRLLVCMETYLAHVETDPEVYRFLDAEFVGRPANAGSELSGLIPRIADQMAVVIADGLRTSGRDDAAAEAWAYGVIGLIHFTGVWWLDNRVLSREVLAVHLTDLLMHGLAVLPSPADVSTTAVQAMRS